MNTKNQRLRKIKSFLRMQSDPVTVTEIHEALSLRMNLDISRKTVERDIIEMVDNQLVLSSIGVPSKFTLNKTAEIELSLKVEEIQTILKVVEAEGELFRKLSKCLE
jgi:hypothetical protein